MEFCGQTVMRPRVLYRLRELLDRDGVAKALGMSPGEADKLIRLPGFPPAVNRGKWSRADVEHWWTARRNAKRHSTFEPWDF
jgi:predicted DNA-binding transcriptional regulator AlpA